MLSFVADEGSPRETREDEGLSVLPSRDMRECDRVEEEDRAALFRWRDRLRREERPERCDRPERDERPLIDSMSAPADRGPRVCSITSNNHGFERPSESTELSSFKIRPAFLPAMPRTPGDDIGVAVPVPSEFCITLSSEVMLHT